MAATFFVRLRQHPLRLASWAIGFVVVASILVLLGGRRASRGAESSKRPAVVRLTTGNTIVAGERVFTGLQAVVVNQGWLERELGQRGIRLEWVPIPGSATGPLINEGFANGRIDLASYGDLPSIIANAGGVRTALVVPTGRGSDTYLVVPPESTARSLSDLKGQRIAVHRGRPWELPLSRLVDSLGLTYADFQVLNLNPEAGASALAARKVDALIAINAHLLVEKGIGKIIWSTAEAPPDWKMRAELWASRSFAEKYPELTQLVATAYVRAAHWASLDENRGEMLKILSRNGTPLRVLEKEYGKGEAWKNRWSPLFEPALFEHYRFAIDYSERKGIIRKGFDFREAHDQRFVKAALRELGLEGHWKQSGGTDT